MFPLSKEVMRLLGEIKSLLEQTHGEIPMVWTSPPEKASPFESSSTCFVTSWQRTPDIIGADLDEQEEMDLAALRQSTAACKQATVDRLQRAIEVLKRQRREISPQTVYEECGLRYAAIYRNPEALALFRANSTHKQLAVSVDVAVKREARIVELEAKLAELEPYRTFVEHMRAQMRREEQGRFGDLP